MLAFGVHHGTNRFEIGSQDLKSEFAHQLDLSLDYNTNHIDLNRNPFITALRIIFILNQQVGPLIMMVMS